MREMKREYIVKVMLVESKVHIITSLVGFPKLEVHTFSETN